MLSVPRTCQGIRGLGRWVRGAPRDPHRRARPGGLLAASAPTGTTRPPTRHVALKSVPPGRPVFKPVGPRGGGPGGGSGRRRAGSPLLPGPSPGGGHASSRSSRGPHSASRRPARSPCWPGATPGSRCRRPGPPGRPARTSVGRRPPVAGGAGAGPPPLRQPRGSALCQSARGPPLGTTRSGS